MPFHDVRVVKQTSLRIQVRVDGLRTDDCPVPRRASAGDQIPAAAGLVPQTGCLPVGRSRANRSPELAIFPFCATPQTQKKFQNETDLETYVAIRRAFLETIRIFSAIGRCAYTPPNEKKENGAKYIVLQVHHCGEINVGSAGNLQTV